MSDTDSDSHTDSHIETGGGTLGGPHAHGELLREVAGVLTSVDEVQDYLDRVVHAVRRHVSGCDEVGITLVVGGRPSTAAYTTVTTLEIDAVQYQLGEGPCLDAARQRTEVVATVGDDGDAAGRWPHFAEAVRRDGLRSLMALPLRSGDECVGALNLYGARRLAGQLEQAMANRAVIEQAKGVLMALRQVDEHEAFDWLRSTSQARNVKVRDLADQIVTGVTGGAGAAEGSTAG